MPTSRRQQLLARLDNLRRAETTTIEEIDSARQRREQLAAERQQLEQELATIRRPLGHAFAELLRARMELLKLSQTRLARAFGVQQAQVNGWLRRPARSHPLDRWDHMAGLLGMTFAEFAAELDRLRMREETEPDAPATPADASAPASAPVEEQELIGEPR